MVDRRIGDVSGEIEHQCQGQFGRRWYKALVGMTDQHGGGARRRNVDRADVDGCSEERQQFGEFGEHCPITGGRTMGDDHVAVLRRIDQLGRGEVPIERVEYDAGKRRSSGGARP